MMTVAVLVGLAIGLGIIWCMIWVYDRLVNGDPEKNKRLFQEELSHRNTVIGKYLWIIKLLKENDYSIVDRQGLDTNHLILTFRNSRGNQIILEHNYGDINEDQGKCFLKSKTDRKQFYLFSKEKQTPEIIEWIKAQ